MFNFHLLSVHHVTEMACNKNIRKKQHCNNFVVESAALKVYEPNEKKGHQTKAYAVDTQISSSSPTTKKHQTFVVEPMGEKSVIQLAGVGDVTAKNLETKGYNKATPYHI